MPGAMIITMLSAPNCVRCFPGIQQQDQEAAGKVCVDIQPLMDKAWLFVRDLAGWAADDPITKELGSWVFIGQTFT